jgi:addiction module HigA family antidote
MALDYEVTMCSRPTRDDLARFFSAVEFTAGGCWLWTAAVTPTGYAQFEGQPAYRIVYVWFVGPIPDGDHVHHKCRTRHCVNPSHLKALSPTMHASVRWQEQRPYRIIEAAMRRAPTHPGEIFEEEFRKPSNISQAEAARRMGMSANRLNEIVAGKRSVTAETAVLMGALTKTNPRMWLHLQADHDLWHALQTTKTDVIKVVSL